MQQGLAVDGVAGDREFELATGAIGFREVISHKTAEPRRVSVHGVGPPGLPDVRVGISQQTELKFGKGEPVVGVAYVPGAEVDQPPGRSHRLFEAARVVESLGQGEERLPLVRLDVESAREILGGPVILLEPQTRASELCPRGGHPGQTVCGGQEFALGRDQLSLREIEPPLEIVRLVKARLGLAESLESREVAAGVELVLARRGQELEKGRRFGGLHRGWRSTGALRSGEQISGRGIAGQFNRRAQGLESRLVRVIPGKAHDRAGGRRRRRPWPPC